MAQTQAESAFRAMLAEINTQLGHDYCEFVSADGNHMKYDFNGYICCDMVIEPGGVVHESVDENPAQRYESVLSWAEHILNELKIHGDQ
jgi:hypothetical protein